MKEFVFPIFVAATTLLTGITVLLVSLTGSPWFGLLIPVFPGLTAVILSLQLDERDQLGDLVQSLINRDFARPWYAVSALLLPAISIISLVIFAVTGDAELEFGSPRLVLVLAALPLAFCNELGWRGFAPRQLPERYGRFLASVIIGVLWVGSLTPIYLLDLADLTRVPLYELALALIPVSTLMFWLEANTKSLLTTVILGASGIMVVALLPIVPGESVQQVTLWLIIGFLWVTALLVVGSYGTDGLDHSIRELPPDELPVGWEKVMPGAEQQKRNPFGSRNGKNRDRKTFSGVGKKTRR